MPLPPNPYQSPLTASLPVEPALHPETAGPRLVLAWAGAVLANTVVGLLLMGSVVERTAYAGVFLGIAAVIAAGGFIVYRSRWIGQAMVLGGYAVALTQVFPLYHMMVGIFVVGLVDVDPADFVTPLSPERAFLATALTGAIIMSTGFVVGLMLQWMLRHFARELPT